MLPPDDLAMDPAATEPVMPVVAEPTAPDPAQAAQIKQFLSMVEAPTWLADAFKEMDADRRYVATECMLAGTKDAVAVNHILRNQHTMLAHLGYQDVVPFVQPARQVANIVPPIDELFAQTVDVFLQKHIRATDLARKVDGACQDASTARVAWLKITLQTDFTKDPIGNSRFGDMQQEVARWEDLKVRIDSGEVTDPDPAMAEYIDLDRTLRIYAAGLIEEQMMSVPLMSPQSVVDPATGLVQTILVPDQMDPRETQRRAIIDGQPYDLYGVPKVDAYKRFVVDQIQPEDIRWDWTVTRLEDLCDAEWVAHRVFMSPSTVRRKWKLAAKEFGAAAMYGANGTSLGHTVEEQSSEDPSSRSNVEQTTLNGLVAVWELWHKGHGRRYVFVEGMARFLENEVPQAVGLRWYPFFPAGFNRVTGKFLPLSDTSLQRPVQDEYNMLRSHNREAIRASYPVLFVPIGLLSKGAIEKYRNRGPFSVIEVARADDVNKYVKESTAIPYDPGKFAFGMNKAEQDMQKMSGVPTTVAGVVGSDATATQDVMAKQGFDVLTTRRRNIIGRMLTDMLVWMTEVGLKVWSENEIKEIAGEAAVWPKMSAEALATRLSIEVKGSLGTPAEAKNRLDFWTNVAAIAQTLGLPINGVTVMRELLDAGGIRTSVERFILPGIPSIPGQAPGGPGQPPGTSPQENGQGGGAPPMAEREVPTSPEQLPNHPPMA